MTSSSECEILQNSQIIRDRWKIKQKLGGGGFGEIYEAIDLQSHNERVAVKVESAKATKQVLKMEVAVLRRLQGKKHACKFYGCGRNDRYNYLVMSLQGKNLADLRRESPKQCFSVSTAVRLASQILASIREIHATGFLHRDIKPSNFAMGRTTSTMKVVYMLDFGLARLYLNARNEIRSPRLAAGFRGTVRYAAVSAHKNKEMGRQDDLWSLFYMLVEFLQGALPWRRIKDKDEVGRMKEEANIEQLLDGCPFELLDFPKHLKTLGYPDEPNYDLLERCLWSCMARLGINMDDPYDWEIGYENVSGRSKTTSNTATNGNISTRMRSHTTAVRDRGPDDKNRAMDTQAPITMGEDEDEQTGNNFKFPPPLGNSVKSSQDENADKPKYKRQEFMRPKYGAVSFDVIDAVNARLAAADSNGQPINGGIAPAQSNEALFSRMRIETSVENAPQIYGITRATVEATIEQPPVNQEDKSKPSQKSLTLSAGGKRYGYSKALIQRYEDDLKILQRGKRLSKKMNAHFEDETKNRIYYLYFIMEPLAIHPTTLKAFVQSIRYVGKGSGDRIAEHGYCILSKSCQGIVDLITGCRSNGQRPIGFKVKCELVNKEVGIYEKAVLQAIGRWNLLNEKGEGSIKDFGGWSVGDDAVFGSRVLAEAFKTFTSTPIDKHWRYALEQVKNRQRATVKANAAQHANNWLKSITGRELKTNLFKRSTLNHRIADNDEFIKIPENADKSQIKQLFSLIEGDRIDSAMLSPLISALPSTSDGDASKRQRQVDLEKSVVDLNSDSEYDEPTSKKFKK